MHIVWVDEPFCINGQHRGEGHSVWIPGIVDGESVDFIADEVDLVLVAEGEDRAEAGGRIASS